MQNHEESPFIQFIRAGVLLFALIAVPGIAVCWNFLPKNCSRSIFFDGNKSGQSDNSDINPVQPKKMPVTKVSENKNDKIPELPAFPAAPFDNQFVNNFANQPAYSTEGIRTAAVDVNDGTAETNIPAAFVPSPAEWASAVASNAQIADMQTEGVQADTAYSDTMRISDMPQNGLPLLVPKADYPALEKELNALGAKYYRLEKWGRQGNLFRFSCYVSPNPEVTYQKYFQAIDSDEIRVMQRVVNEIKQWKMSQ